MRQWMVAAKKADFYAIAEKFHVDPVVARIIRNREVIGEKNIRIYLGGNLSDLSDPHQMKDMDRLVDSCTKDPETGAYPDYRRL